MVYTETGKVQSSALRYLKEVTPGAATIEKEED